MNSIPYLSREVLSELKITTNDVIQSIENLIVACEKGTARSAPKAVMLTEDGRYMMAALAAMDEPNYLAVKTVVLNPRNSDRGIPQINGLVTVLDSETGLPVAILDGNWVTALRTAGLSAVAAKHMARKDSSSMAFIGCGVQAVSHLNAFNEMFPLSEIKVFGRGQTNIDNLCKVAGELSLLANVCQSAEEAISDADIVVSSVTFSQGLKPFLDASWLKAGSFAAVTDLAAPWDKESFAAFDKVTVDDLEQEAASPHKLVSMDFVTGDLTGLVLGKFSGRDSSDQRTGFIFRGHALGDLALTSLALQKAG